MSYIGQQLPADVFSGFTTDSFTGDGSATTFTLSKAPFSEDGLIVVINNVIQKPTTNFTVSGTTLTIVGTAVASSDVIYAIHTSGAVPSTLASKVDVNGVSDAIILDADADTTISADTDDQIDIKIGGSDIFQMTASKLDLNGKELVLDADADTSITADTDDQIDFKVGGSDVLTLGPSNLSVDISGNIRLDAGDNGEIRLLDDGTQYGALKVDSSRLKIQGIVSDADMLFVANDGGSEVTALTIDASEAGLAIFHTGVALGGTGAANTLDDYEEGTWTPAAANTSDYSGFAATNMSVSMARYTKVGRAVSIMAKISFPDSGSSALAVGDSVQIDGLPFSIGGSGTDDVFGAIPAQPFLRDSTNGGVAHATINYLDDIVLRIVAVNGSGRRDQTILSLSGTYFAD